MFLSVNIIIVGLAIGVDSVSFYMLMLRGKLCGPPPLGLVPAVQERRERAVVKEAARRVGADDRPLGLPAEALAQDLLMPLELIAKIGSSSGNAPARLAHANATTMLRSGAQPNEAKNFWQLLKLKIVWAI